MEKHVGTWGMVLADDGTMDTVIACSACGEQFRFNYERDGEQTYDEFVEWALDDAAQEHQSELAS